MALRETRRSRLSVSVVLGRHLGVWVADLDEEVPFGALTRHPGHLSTAAAQGP